MSQNVISRENKRLATLRATGLLQAGVVPSLDRLTAFAARLLTTPVALVSLVGADRQLFVSAHGLTGELRETRSTPLTHSFCRYVVAQEAPLIVADARHDNRLRNHPAIAAYGAVAYAGFPLRAPDGDVLGAFCVADSQPRDWTTDQLATLGELADAAGLEVAVRLARAGEAAAARRTAAVLDGTHDACVSVDRAGRVVGWNAAAEQMFGYTAGQASGEPVDQLIVPERFRQNHRTGMARLTGGGEPRHRGAPTRVTVVDSSGHEFPAEMSLQTSDEFGEAVHHAFLHDISVRVTAAAELDRHRQRLDYEHAFLQALLESSDAGVVACDSSGRLMIFNRGMRELIGRPAAPDLKMDDWARHFRFYEPDGRTLLAELPLARAAAGETVRGHHFLIKQKDGWRRLVANAKPIDTADGRRLGAVMTTHDVTEAHRAESLRRSRLAVAQVLSRATHATDAAVASVAAITEELGWLRGEYWQVTEDRQRITRLSTHSTRDHEGGAGTPDEAPALRRGEGLPGLVWMRNGEVWWNTGDPPADVIGAGSAELAAAGVRVAVGVPVRSGRRTLGVLAFHLDQDLPYDGDTAEMLDAVAAHLAQFLERRWAEDMSLMLADARRSFNRVVEQVHDYVWSVEVVDGQPPVLVYGSPNATGVFGPLAPGAPAPALTDRLHPDDAELMAAFHRALAAGPAELECRIVGVDQRVRWIWTRATPRREHGRFFVDGISTDVSERRQLAEQRELLLDRERRQVEQLRDLDRMKDELAAVVIHELRNPVGVIRGYTEMLLDSAALPAPERRHATVIERSTLHLQGLVDDLLDLARLAAGHLSVDPRPVPGCRLVRDVLENHAPSAAAKRLTVADHVQTGLTVLADSGRLRQALDNLISNAVKYTPDGGTVTVRAERHGDDVVIEVSDTGIGIPDEQYDHLFSRFFRASNATQAGIKGTGLGLAVTKAIVQAHSGTIGAGPVEGGGTRFTVTLPAA
jgi:PAS domain S-box-containing protein